jgi:hypothetical protein
MEKYHSMLFQLQSKKIVKRTQVGAKAMRKSAITTSTVTIMPTNVYEHEYSNLIFTVENKKVSTLDGVKPRAWSQARGTYLRP